MSKPLHERLLIALESCANKLTQLGNVFNAPNFTDRYGDGPICIGLAKHARAVLDEARTASESPLKTALEAIAKGYSGPVGNCHGLSGTDCAAIAAEALKGQQEMWHGPGVGQTGAGGHVGPSAPSAGALTVVELDPPADKDPFDQGYVRGWNECLREVRESSASSSAAKKARGE